MKRKAICLTEACDLAGSIHRNADLTWTDAAISRLKAFRCDFAGCDKSYTKPSKLADHARSHTGERPFCCSEPHCDKRFLRKSHLTAHARSHLPKEERPYLCTEVGCEKRFSTNQHLRQHINLHTEPQPYQCIHCEATFHKNYQLKRHLSEVHQQEKPCTCPVHGCDKAFAYQSILTKHIARVHDETKRYGCEIDACHASFTKWSALQKHVKDEHKLKCRHCSKTYSDGHSFKLHLATHELPLENRQKFPCSQCERKFTKLFALKKHVSFKHDGIREFACSLCPAEFAHKKTLKEHITRKHSDVQTPEIRKRRKLIPEISMLERLTGSSYNELRTIPCSFPNCQYMFAREYDLARHLQSLHAKAIDRSRYHDGKQHVSSKVSCI